MKTVTKITSKSQGDIQVSVRIEINTKNLTKSEIDSYKQRITDSVHRGLQDHFHVAQLIIK